MQYEFDENAALRFIREHYRPLETDQPGDAFLRAHAECLAMLSKNHAVIATLSQSTFENCIESADILRVSIDDLDITERAKNSLKFHGIISVNDLASRPTSYLRTIPNLGKKSLIEIQRSLGRHGIRLKDH